MQNDTIRHPDRARGLNRKDAMRLRRDRQLNRREGFTPIRNLRLERAYQAAFERLLIDFAHKNPNDEPNPDALMIMARREVRSQLPTGVRYA